MAQDRQGTALDVVRHHELAAAQQRPRPAATDQGDRRARSGAEGQARPVAGGAGQAHGIVEDLVVDRQVAGDPLQGENVFVLQQRPQVGHVEHVAARGQVTWRTRVCSSASAG